MNRILAAGFIAILSHAVLFTMNPAWLTGKKIYNIKPQGITITMSMSTKKAPVFQPPALKKETKVIKKEKIVKPVKTPVTPSPIKTEPKSAESETVTLTAESTDISGDNTVADPVTNEGTELPQTTGTASGTGVTQIITEAEPLYKVNPEPPYPKMARKRGYQGTVILSVLVNKEGRAENLWVFESSGYNILDNAALDAVKEWLFEPGKQGDTAVDMWVQVPVRFEIK
jgi:periplasmic protein TonB